MNLNQLNDLIDGELINPIPGMALTGVASPELAKPSEVVCLFNSKTDISKCKSKVIITKEKVSEFKHTQLIHPNPRLAMAKVMQVFYKKQAITNHLVAINSDIHESVDLAVPVHIDSFVKIGEASSIGEHTTISSSVSIGKNCKIGKNCTIFPSVTIYDNCVIGDDTTIHANSIIGADGFGYEQDNGKWIKIPQIGGVKIGTNVEIGSNTTIDGGCLQATEIKSGVKIDNFVHIAHNCIIGQNTIIAGGALIGGSTVIENHCIIAGDVTISNNLIIGENAIVFGKSGVTKNIAKNSKVSGYPAQNHREEIKYQAYLKRLFNMKN